VVDLSPIIHEGGCITSERSEKTTNRFVIHTPWLAMISTSDFLNEHWHEEGIHAVFRDVSHVVEIDPDCDREEDKDFSCLRVVVTRETPDLSPDEIYLGNYNRTDQLYEIK
jgi:hypothetical protein